jgi:Mrp family chromosome partitioning ATPase
MNTAARQVMKTTGPLYPLTGGAAALPELQTLAVIGATRAEEAEARTDILALTPRAGTRALPAARPRITVDWSLSESPLGESWEEEWERAWEMVVPAAPPRLLPRGQSEMLRAAASAPPAAPLPRLTAEARQEFQRLRRALLLAAEQRGVQALLVSGVGAGDGASFVTRQVSRLLAESGRCRVARVEVARSAAGAAGGDELFALRETELPNLCEASFTPDLPQAAAAFQAFLERLREHFDFILIDAPAVTAHPATARLGALADGVALVARDGATPHRLIEAAYDLFDEARASLLGVVLNRCDAPAPARG